MDDRLGVNVDWQALERARRIAFFWHLIRPGVGICALRDTFDNVQVVKEAMPDDMFGFVVGKGMRWRIEVNDRLPLAATHATLGHEFGHTLQRRALDLAFCAPRAGLSIVEQEAHAIGAILTVPYGAVRDLAMGDLDTARRIAVQLTVPVSYVRIRAALTVLLDERPGSRAAAEDYLDFGLLSHQLWMARTSDYLIAQGA